MTALLDSLIAQQARCRANTRKDAGDFCERACERCDRAKAYRAAKATPAATAADESESAA
jgi:hypothetical protein